MLYDIERTIKRMEEKYKSKEYRDLVYDLESFIIDLGFDGEQKGQDENISIKENSEQKVLEQNIKKAVYTELRRILTDLEINENLKGFRILEECIFQALMFSLNNQSYRMMDIYPLAAEKFGINAHNAERLCRYACSYIKVTKRFALKYPLIESITHRTYEKVTVKELCDLLVYYISVKLKLANVAL